MLHVFPRLVFRRILLPFDTFYIIYFLDYAQHKNELTEAHEKKGRKSRTWLYTRETEKTEQHFANKCVFYFARWFPFGEHLIIICNAKAKCVFLVSTSWTTDTRKHIRNVLHYGFSTHN